MALHNGELLVTDWTAVDDAAHDQILTPRAAGRERISGC